jgi:hypothetical protein
MFAVVAEVSMSALEIEEARANAGNERSGL